MKCSKHMTPTERRKAMTKSEAIECSTKFNESVTTLMKCFDNAIFAAQEREERKKVCFNASGYRASEFICSECGVIILDCQRHEYDEESGDLSCYEFVYRYCPMCGKRIGDKE